MEVNGVLSVSVGTHIALKELERLGARDQDAVVVSPDPVSPVTQTPETQLQILGSLR
jgi:hypothetical protein